jgi:hypothetical protein
MLSRGWIKAINDVTIRPRGGITCSSRSRSSSVAAGRSAFLVHVAEYVLHPWLERPAFVAQPPLDRHGAVVIPSHLARGVQVILEASRPDESECTVHDLSFIWVLPSRCSRTADSRSTCQARAPSTAPRPTRPCPVAGGPRSRPRGTAWDLARTALPCPGGLGGVEAGGARRVTVEPRASPTSVGRTLAACRSSLFVTAT